MRSALAALLALAAPVTAQTLPDIPEVRRIVGTYADRCAAETGGGTLDIEDGAFTEVDLDGDARTADMVVDFNHVFCSRAVSLWSGSGGSPVHLVVGDESGEVFGGPWQIVDFGNEVPTRVFLIGVHGSQCDGYGAQACVRAVVFDGGIFSTQPYPE